MPQTELTEEQKTLMRKWAAEAAATRTAPVVQPQLQPQAATPEQQAMMEQWRQQAIGAETENIKKGNWQFAKDAALFIPRQMLGSAETGLALGTGMAAGLVNDVNAAAEQFGYPQQRRLSGYQPRTQAGNRFVDAISAVMSPIAKYGTDPVFNPWIESQYAPMRAVGYTARAASNALPLKLPAARASAAAEAQRSIQAATARVQGTARRLDTPAVQQAREFGAQIPPHAVNERQRYVGTFSQRVGEGMQGPQMQQQVHMNNQRLVNDAAAQDIGLPKGTYLTNDTVMAQRAGVPTLEQYRAQTTFPEMDALTDLMNQRGKPFRVTTNAQQQFFQDLDAAKALVGEKATGHVAPSVAKLFDRWRNVQSATVKDLMEDVRTLRSDATKISSSTSPTAATISKAKAYRAIADAIENLVDRSISASGHSDLVPRFQAARRLDAKINLLKDNLVRDNVVNPAGYAQLIDEAGGTPGYLTGQALEMARAARNMPDAFSTQSYMAAQAGDLARGSRAAAAATSNPHYAGVLAGGIFGLRPIGKAIGPVQPYNALRAPRRNYITSAARSYAPNALVIPPLATAVREDE